VNGIKNSLCMKILLTVAVLRAVYTITGAFNTAYFSYRPQNSAALRIPTCTACKVTGSYKGHVFYSMLHALATVTVTQH